MEPEVVQRFLESVGQPNDVAFWVRLFRAERRESFAVLAVDARVLEQALDPLHFDLRILAGIGLVPVVLLGLVEPRGAEAGAQKLAQWLEEDRVGSIVLPANGDAAAAVAALREQIAANRIPIVPMRAGAGQNVDDRFARLAEIVAGLGTRKVVFLGSRGGLGDPPREIVNLSLDVDDVLASLTGKQAALLRQVRRLLEKRVQQPLTVSVTSPLNLLRELFTLRGAGTLIRRGVRVERHASLEGVDVERLRALIESSFGRRLQPEFLARPFETLLLVEHYQAAALCARSPLGTYLTKFAVDRRAQGEGVGSDLWSALVREHASFFWRSRGDNPINAWYARQCDGLQRGPEWHVFWRGMPADRLAGLVGWALAQPADFAD